METDGKTITYTAEDLAAMSPEQRNDVFLKATKMEGVGVVRDADGNIKYDDPSLAGSYGENEQ